MNPAIRGDRPGTRHLVVMGVSGSGKTTVAQGIAQVTGLTFAEADDFHPPSNVAKMRAGIPLTDADRWQWLHDLAAWMASQAAQDRSTVIACSALRRAYRDVLVGGPPSIDFVHLTGETALIRQRLSIRAGHYMPASLLDSQIDTLEELQADESGIVLDVGAPVGALVGQVVAGLAIPESVLRRNGSGV